MPSRFQTIWAAGQADGRDNHAHPLDLWVRGSAKLKEDAMSVHNEILELQVFDDQQVAAIFDKALVAIRSNCEPEVSLVPGMISMRQVLDLVEYLHFASIEAHLSSAMEYRKKRLLGANLFIV